MDLNEQEQMNEDIRQFLIESTENLVTLDDEIVRLERTPEDKTLISSVFRTIHTIKGTCGFFGYERLGATAHITENILSQVRAEQRKLTPNLISLVLEAVDRIKLLLASIEATGNEGSDDCAELIGRLEQAHLECDSAGTDAHLQSETMDDSQPDLMIETLAEPEPEVEATPQPIADLPSKASALAAAEKPSESSPRRSEADSTIRVDVGLLDKLMNLVGELVLARNQLLQDTSTQSATLQKTSQRLNLITSELQEGVMKTRMQPIGVVWNKMPRIVRDLAQQCGKQLRIEMIGADTELDKTIIEAIKDPLTHIVRNSCDHGVELPEARERKNKDAEGLLLLRAYHEGGVVNIEIADDGAGIDPQKMKSKAIERGLITEEQAAQMSDRTARELIFAAGFSTAEKVTSISGRGVGMDVVKTNIEKIGGNVEIAPGEPCGTVVRIRIPLTLAIIPGLIVSLEPERKQAAESALRMRDERFVIPQANLLELVRLEGARIQERIKSLHGTPIFSYRGKLLPLVSLRRILGKTPREMQGVVSIVVLHAEGRQIALVVDEIHDTQEIVVKPLGRQLKGLECYLGGTIMGDGLPALILDVAGLGRIANLQGRNLQSANEPERTRLQQVPQPTQMLLLFRAGSFDRLAIPLPLVARLEKVPSSRIERAAGQAVLHYREKILPLVSLARMLDPGCVHDTFAPEIIQVIVFTDGVRCIGVVVDEIMDIVDEAITVRRESTAFGLLGSAIIGGRVTDLLDLHAIVEASGANWLGPDQAAEREHSVLLADACVPAREMIAEYLGASGYVVSSVASVPDALSKMRRVAFDLIITSVESDGNQGEEMLKVLRKEKQFAHIPVLGLVEREEQLVDPGPEGLAYDARILRSKRNDLLASVAALVRPSTGGRREPIGEVA